MPTLTTRLTTIAATAVMASALSAGAEAIPPGTDGFTPYGEVEGWNVFVDNGRGTCLIERVGDDGVAVQMGLTADATFGYVGVFTQAPTNAEGGKIRTIEIQMGDNRYAGEVAEMAGNLKGGYSGGYVLANDPGFVKDVEQQYVMMVMPEGVEPFEVDLTGTKKAIAAARECNAAQS